MIARREGKYKLTYMYANTHQMFILVIVGKRRNNEGIELFGDVKRHSHKMASALRNEDSCVTLLCYDSEFKVQQADDAGGIVSSTEP